jgi:hypothetical protein
MSGLTCCARGQRVAPFRSWHNALLVAPAMPTLVPALVMADCSRGRRLAAPRSGPGRGTPDAGGDGRLRARRPCAQKRRAHRLLDRVRPRARPPFCTLGEGIAYACGLLCPPHDAERVVRATDRRSRARRVVSPHFSSSTWSSGRSAVYDQNGMPGRPARGERETDRRPASRGRVSRVRPTFRRVRGASLLARGRPWASCRIVRWLDAARRARFAPPARLGGLD